ncbi:MAG: Ribosomal protein methyltransferase [Myxococcaceae bacterium]|nr:Ribosomal protein methyltransferase [Myxococcaceae bacterium]
MSDPSFPLVIVETDAAESDALLGRLSMAGAECIEERDATTLYKGGARGVTLVASFGDEAVARAALASLGPDVEARLEFVVGDAWRDGWKQHWQPTRITERVVVVPSWTEYEPLATDMLLRFDPGRAFGTGQHASTTLAAQKVEREVLSGRHSLLLDLGCGSGILAFVAVLHGLPRAIACDIDRESVESAAENAAMLGFADRLDLRVGGFEVVPETATLVVANIEAVVLVPGAAEVAARVAPGGVLILSGILATQRAMLTEAYVAQGLRPGDVAGEGDWISMEFHRP